jgi:hypothetical protein
VGSVRVAGRVAARSVGAAARRRLRRRAALSALLAALVVGFVGGCGNDGSVGVATGTEPSTSTTWVLDRAPARVVSVDRRVDDFHLSVTVADVPSGPTASCTAVPVDETDKMITNDIEAVRVQVILQRADGQPFAPEGFGTWPGCTLARQSFVVGTGAPIGSRAVVIHDPEYSIWNVRPDGAYTRCELPGCDPQTGSAPDPCGHELIDAVRAGDVPAHSDINVRGCDGNHAVVDVDLGSGACPRGDEGPNPCAGTRIDRTFWSRTNEHWSLITYGTRSSPGCADALLPAGFPTALCAGLPPAVTTPST